MASTGPMKANIGKGRAQFFKRDALARFLDRQGICHKRFNLARQQVAALGLESEPACDAPFLLPTNCCRGRNTEPVSGCAAAHSIVNRGENGRTQ